MPILTLSQSEFELESKFEPRLWALHRDEPGLYEALLTNLAPVGLSSVDLRVDRVFFLGGTDVRLFFNVTNLFDRNNVCCVDSFDFAPQPDGSLAVDRREIYGLPRLISFGVTWSF